MKKAYLTAIVCIALIKISYTQEEDLLHLVNQDSSKKEFVTSAFKSSRVIMSHSMEMLHAGILDFRILHRFGNINDGAYEFFGLDNATIRLGLDYALGNNFTIGIGRSTHKKELDGFMKLRVIRQTKGARPVPVSLVFVGGSTINTLKVSEPERKNFRFRLGYYGQLIIGRKFSESFTLQLSPIIVHQNLVRSIDDPNDLIALGTGGRLKLTKRISLNVDYFYVFNLNETSLYNPLSVGLDIETGGHVFQLHFTNAIGMNERAFLSETNNNWGKGDIQFGFNISRSFQLGKRKRHLNH